MSEERETFIDTHGVERDKATGQVMPGSTANPNGRPKGKTLKEYAREYYMLKSDEEKRAYLDKLEEKIPGFAWRMAEGNPHNTEDITSGGKPLYLPPELLNKNDLPSQGPEPDSQ